MSKKRKSRKKKSIKMVSIGIFVLLLLISIGLFGIIKTGISGLFFAVIYISTNSIIPGIVLHFFMDFSSAFILKAEK